MRQVVNVLALISHQVTLFNQLYKNHVNFSNMSFSVKPALATQQNGQQRRHCSYQNDIHKVSIHLQVLWVSTTNHAMEIYKT